MITRFKGLSLLFYLKHHLFSDVEEEILENPVSGSGKFFLKNKDLVVTRPFILKLDGVEVEPSLYTVYPLEGSVLPNFTLIGELTFSYSYSYCHVALTFPEGELRIPMITIEDDNDNFSPLELGTSRKQVDSLIRFHIYGANEGQRDDLADSLVTFLDANIPVYNFNQGFPIAFGGILNRDFDFQDRITYVSCENFRIRRNPLNSGEQFEKGRCIVSCSCLFER